MLMNARLIECLKIKPPAKKIMRQRILLDKQESSYSVKYESDSQITDNSRRTTKRRVIGDKPVNYDEENVLKRRFSRKLPKKIMMSIT